MPKYYVSLIIDVTKVVTVEADNEKEAIEKALENVDMLNLCHQCSKEVEVGDFTGEAVVSLAQ